MLTREHLDHFATNGWLLLSPFGIDEVSDLVRMVDQVQSSDGVEGILHHREMTSDGPKLCRTENFIPFHDGLRRILTTGILPTVVGELLGESVHLYKEKINYKLAGGAGFRPHQDAPAYPFIRRSISVMIAIDESTIENGCLEVCDAQHHVELPTDARGCILDEWTDRHQWHPVEMNPGEVLVFDALTPHRSGPNESGRDRRALFPTYNAQSEGDLRTSYYEEKLRVFRESPNGGSTVRVSLIDDFEGRPVE